MNAPSVKVEPTPSSHGEPWWRERPDWSQIPGQVPRSGMSDKHCLVFLLLLFGSPALHQDPTSGLMKLIANGKQGGTIPFSLKI